MKKSIILCVAIFAAFTAFAQNTMATLNHNDTVTVYYGIGALRRAYTAAVDGDVITLSSGTFYATSINKAVTIRGAGMCYDSLTNTYPTILADSSSTVSGIYVLSVAGNDTQRLEIEGVWWTPYNVRYGSLRNALFSKVRFSSSFHVHVGNRCNYSYCQFIRCIFQGGLYNDSNCVSNTFINCAISSIPDGHYTLYNCVASVTGSQFTAYNSILFTLYSGPTYPYTNCSASVYNCIGFAWGTNAAANLNYFSAIQSAYNHTIYGNNKFAQVFRTAPLTPGSAISFDYDSQKFFLTDSIIAVYPGSDGTQVGIYGGAAPFNPRPDYIRIQQCTVAPRTTLDGKLNVDIEVINEH